MLTDEFLALNRKLFAGVEVTPGDAGRRRHPPGRPRRRLPRPPPHRQERAQGAVAPDDHQPPGPRALGGRGRARPQGESPPQGPQAARDPPARAAAGRRWRRASTRWSTGSRRAADDELRRRASRSSLGRRRPRERAARARADRRPRRRTTRPSRLLRSRGARCDGRRVYLDDGMVQRGAGHRALVVRARRPPSRARPAARRRRRPRLRLGLRRRLHARGSTPMRPGTLADLGRHGQARPPAAGDRLQQRLHGAAGPARGACAPAAARTPV